ncbi:DNA adenine methylase [Achromobacter insolitus]|uniref:DNA adenine methylase n=1 Tax=Achromobacter insolitus TaxID=217204 RepID=UPI0028B039B2|nr:DNA adenine methylase [Achromobacter insolitus]
MALPIFPWIGGKRRLVDRLLPYIPTHQCYVEPFAGGAAMFFMRPTPADVEVLNDVNSELVNLYRVVKHHMEEFVRQFKWAFSSRQIFKWLQMTPEETLTDIQRAARFYYLQHAAFGGRVQGQTYGTATTTSPGFLLRLEETLSAAWLRLADTYIENLPWEDCMRRYDRPHTFFFCDPPYWETEGYGVGFEWGQYEALARTLAGLKGKAIVTLNDHPAIRELFRDFVIESTDIRYTVGGGAGVERREVVIFSWDIRAEPVALF